MARSDYWLDELPDEVCAQIALQVSGGHITRDALIFAKTSPKQANAVVASLSPELEIKDYSWVGAFRRLGRFGERSWPTNPEHLKNQTEIPKWMEMIKGHIEELSCMYPWYEHKEEGTFLSLLAAPNLRIVRIAFASPALHLISESSSIRELYLRWATSVDYGLMFYTFRKLKIEKLTLECSVPSSKHCLFGKKAYFSGTDNAIAESCPHLVSLGIQCKCRRDEHPIWRVFPELPSSLEEIVFHGNCFPHPPDNLRPRIATLDSVRLKSRRRCPLPLALTLGSVVTELSICNTSFLPRHDLQSLTQCPRIKWLTISCLLEAQDALVDTIRALPELKYLDISWGKRDHGGDPSSNMLPGIHLNAVRAAPKLTKLKVTKELKFKEIVDIVEHMGSRIEALDLDLYQSDIPGSQPLRYANELLTILSTLVCGRSRGIRELNFEGRGLFEDAISRNSDVCLRRRLVGMFKRLQRASPHVNITPNVCTIFEKR